MSDLKPCPFCGFPCMVIAYDHAPVKGEVYWPMVVCENCEARTKVYPRVTDAEKAWNTRAISEEECYEIFIQGIYKVITPDVIDTDEQRDLKLRKLIELAEYLRDNPNTVEVQS